MVRGIRRCGRHPNALSSCPVSGELLVDNRPQGATPFKVRHGLPHLPWPWIHPHPPYPRYHFCKSIGCNPCSQAFGMWKGEGLVIVADREAGTVRKTGEAVSCWLCLICPTGMRLKAWEGLHTSP